MFLGIESGGTKLQLGLGLGDGTLIDCWRGAIDVAAGGDGIRRQLEAAIPELLAHAQLPMAALRGFGIGFGGPVDDDSQTIIKSHQINGWDGFPIAKWLTDTFGVPAILGNDADDDAPRTRQRDDVAKRFRKRLGAALENRAGERVARRGVGELLRRPVPAASPGFGFEAPPGDEVFQNLERAVVGADAQVADLGGAALGAAVDAAVEDQPAADARADGDVKDRRSAAAGAEARLRQACLLYTSPSPRD